ncbi:hypothetical protein HHK36_001569 [Tetracentron sinense]|uniref:Uncharacterized protein n=1 Tax=Tetracentron sinense TaxID=13715 RepID=A0A835DR96_TETSI|nr:hypothetical protein HHK36_001569 [Tetracentron sinense]
MQLRHINVGEPVKQKNLHDDWDDEFDCLIIDKDLVCDELEDMMEEGGNIILLHGSELTNNIECKIFQLLREEAKESYLEDIVVAMRSDYFDDVSRNVTTFGRLAPPHKRGRTGEQKNLHDDWDNEFDCHIINEDLVCDEPEDMMEEGGNIIL